ncbi:MAG: Glycogen biosynthesis protein GlgD [Pelotomaculum sp. PtaB.Bin104]|nr:MAG: Glycogen biosynthesis protein GlgD [Pelotomaculum sp. PtaB.Bin104]
MRKTIGIIAGNRRSNYLHGIDKQRPLAAVPFGGRYRLLDFALSSMVNSGLRTVGIITPSNYRPILDELGSGKEWQLDRKSGGLFILPGVNRGLATWDSVFLLKDIAKNFEYLENDFSDYVLLCGCNQIFNIDFTGAIAFHEENQASVTLIYKAFKKEEKHQFNGTYLKMTPEGQVDGFLTGEEVSGADGELPLFIDMVVINRKLLMEIIQGYEAVADAGLKDALLENMRMLRILGFPFKGYFARIESVKNYFESSMDLLKSEVRQELFWGINRVHTKTRDNPPSHYSDQAQVKNSLIASGCKIQGDLENSIVSRNVQVAEDTHIKNSIIMRRCNIGRGVTLENVILDSYVTINEGTILIGQGQAPIVINKRAVF